MSALASGMTQDKRHSLRATAEQKETRATHTALKALDYAPELKDNG